MSSKGSESEDVSDDEEFSDVDHASLGSDGKVSTSPTATAHRQLTTTEFSCIVGTLALIAFLVLTPQLFIIGPYFLQKMPLRTDDALRELCKVLGPFNAGTIGILYNYWRSIARDPGLVPPGWRPPAEIMEAVKRQKEDGIESDDEDFIELRWCKPCAGFKPDRAHHCSTCKRCVFKMDHHCPWVANCVGQANHANFLWFLLWVDITIVMHFALLCMRVADWWWVRMTGAFWRSPSNAEMVWLVLNYAIGGIVGLSVGAFSVWHFWAWWTDITSIESRARSRRISDWQ